MPSALTLTRVHLRRRSAEDANGAAAGGSSAGTAAAEGDGAVQGGARRQAYVSVITTFSFEYREDLCSLHFHNGCTTAVQRLSTVAE
jgi:hypothetical protein